MRLCFGICGQGGRIDGKVKVACLGPVSNSCVFVVFPTYCADAFEKVNIMDEATVREVVETYITTVLGSNGMFIVSVTLGLFVFWIMKTAYQFALRQAFMGPVRSNADFEKRFDARTVDIPPVSIPTATRPQDGRYFQTLLAYVQSKMAEGQALIPQERFILGEMAFLEKLLVSEGLVHLDSYTGDLPHKGFELRRALEEIGATDLADVVERAIAVFLHRQQLLVDLMALGSTRADALLHNSLPSYAPLTAQIAQLGGGAHFIQCADAYFATTYPWANGG